jgi:hypothetical protein
MCARGRIVPDNESGGPAVAVDLDGDGNPESKYIGGLVGCGGGTLPQAWEFLQQYGTLSSACWHYNVENNTSSMPEPPDTVQCDPVVCPDTGGEPFVYKAKSVYVVPGTLRQHAYGSEQNLRNEMVMTGPASATMIMYDDFQAFWDKLIDKPLEMSGKKAVYFWDGKAQVKGVHAVRIVGWGRIETLDYWIIANSWGAKDRQDLEAWGINGCFLMRRGQNDCALEANVVTGTPEVPESALSIFGQKVPSLYSMVGQREVDPRCNVFVVPFNKRDAEKIFDMAPLQPVSRRKNLELAPLTNNQLAITKLLKCPAETPKRCANDLCMRQDHPCAVKKDWGLRGTAGDPGGGAPPDWAIAVAVVAGVLLAVCIALAVVLARAAKSLRGSGGPGSLGSSESLRNFSKSQ